MTIIDVSQFKGLIGQWVTCDLFRVHEQCYARVIGFAIQSYLDKKSNLLSPKEIVKLELYRTIDGVMPMTPFVCTFYSVKNFDQKIYLECLENKNYDMDNVVLSNKVIDMDHWSTEIRYIEKENK